MKSLILFFFLLLPLLYSDTTDLEKVKALLDNNQHFKAVTAAQKLHKKDASEDKNISTLIFALHKKAYYLVEIEGKTLEGLKLINETVHLTYSRKVEDYKLLQAHYNRQHFMRMLGSTPQGNSLLLTYSTFVEEIVWKRKTTKLNHSGLKS